MVRIYCLSNFTKIDPNENQFTINPYFAGADELFPLRSETVTIENLNKVSKIYKLTEICIGFKEIDYFNEVRQRQEEKVKFYVINIFQEEIGLLEFKMLRGAFKFEKVENTDGVYDLTIATSKMFFSKIDFDLRVRIRCIKSTTVKGKISEEEKDMYDRYSVEIEETCHLLDHDTEDDEIRLDFQDQIREHMAFEENILDLPNKSKPNVLRTKLSDINILIRILCDPKNGSFKNVLPKTRYNQRLECLLKDTESWEVKHPRYGKLSNQCSKHRGLRSLHWENVNLCPEKMLNIDLNTLTTIIFKNITIFDDTKQLVSGFPKNAFPALRMLILTSCFIEVIPEYFLDMLPSATLEMLCLSYNDIKIIPENISEFTKLSHLMLHNNPNLKDNGIPWKKLPSSLAFFTLDNTKVTKIPKDIQRFKQMYELHIGNQQLQNIEWKSISSNIRVLLIFGGKNLMKTCNLSDKSKLKWLKITEANIQDIPYSNFPQSIQKLDFSKNKLKTFNSGNSFLNLTELILDNNELQSIAWEFLPSTLILISLSNNALTFIGDISRLTNLETLIVNNNQINCILPGMNNLQHLKRLELQHNQFCYSDKNNLIESLWMQLPITFLDLNLSNNDIQRIPCFIKNLNIVKLRINGCNISQICPYFYTAFCTASRCHSYVQRIEMEDNPDLKYLPFLPQNIFQPSQSRNEPVDAINSQGLLLSIKARNYVSIAEFPRNQILKPVYPFKTCLAENSLIKCNCCSNCGEPTTFAVKKQLMVMDFALRFIKNGKYKCFAAGQWNSNVLIKLCNDCFEIVKQKTDEAYLSFMRYLFNIILDVSKHMSELNINKKHKCQEEIENPDFKRTRFNPLHCQNSDDAMSCVPSSSGISKNDEIQTLSDFGLKYTLPDIHPSQIQSSWINHSNTNCHQQYYEQYQPMDTLFASDSGIFYSNSDSSATMFTNPQYSHEQFPMQYEGSEVYCSTMYAPQNYCNNQFPNYNEIQDLRPMYQEPNASVNHQKANSQLAICNQPQNSQLMYNEADESTFYQRPNTQYAVHGQLPDHQSSHPYPNESVPVGVVQNVLPATNINHDQTISQVPTSSLNNDNNIEFLNIIPQFPSPILPPTTSWLQEKCKAFGIPYFENVSQNRPLINDIQKYTIIGYNDIINVSNDGHCGYRSISVLLCGSDFYHGNIRNIICSKILENTNPNFENLYIFRNAKAIAKAKLEIDTTKPCSNEYWMDDADLTAAAFIFNCNIYVLNSMDDWQLYSPKTFITGQMSTFKNYDESLPTLLMQNKSGNHFTPVKNVSLKRR